MAFLSYSHANLLSLSRLLTDARYLQEKLTGLKNVTAPTAMLETIVSEKRVALPPPPVQHIPAPQSVPVSVPQQTGGRFKGMLARAGTLNGRKASMPAPAPVPVPLPAEKTLPPFADSPSPGPGYTPSPEPPAHPLAPQVDPMGDNAPTPAPTSAPAPAPAPPPINVDVLPEKPLVAEPEGIDDVPPPTPAKTEGPSANGAPVVLNGTGAVAIDAPLPPPPSALEEGVVADGSL